RKRARARAGGRAAARARRRQSTAGEELRTPAALASEVDRSRKKDPLRPARAQAARRDLGVQTFRGGDAGWMFGVGAESRALQRAPRVGGADERSGDRAP